LRIARKDTNVKTIKCDSDLLVKYWARGHISVAKRKTIDPSKLVLINECAMLLKEFESRGGKLLKISGDDNLADLGFHK
jgi:ribonuclease H-related protein